MIDGPHAKTNGWLPWKRLSFAVVGIVLVLFSAGVAHASTSSSKAILKQEIDRMLERTLPDVFSENSGGFLGRRIDEYRTALRELRKLLNKQKDPEREELFDRFEAVLEAGVELRQKQFEDVDDRLDRLREELEEHRETGEEGSGLLRANWIEIYDRRLRPDDEFQRHQRVLIRAFGLLASNSIRSNAQYRFLSSLRMFERLFPEVIGELYDTEDRSRHTVRLYTDLMALLQDRLADLEDPQGSERFYRHVRSSGGLIVQLHRRGRIQSVPKELIRRIRSVVERSQD
jgi:hypothetical protein